MEAPFYLQLRTTPDGRGVGVYSLMHISAGTKLGQYMGRVTRSRPEDETNAYVFRVDDARGRALYFIDSRPLERVDSSTATPFTVGANIVPIGVHEQSANWTRYINSIDPGDLTKQNVEFVRGDDARMYLFAMRTIEPNTELLTDYGSAFFLADIDEIAFESVGTDLDARLAAIVAIVGNDHYTWAMRVARDARLELRVARDRDSRIGLTLVHFGEVVTVHEVHVIDLKNAGAVRTLLFEDIDDAARERGVEVVRAPLTVFVSVDERRARNFEVMVDADNRPLEFAHRRLRSLTFFHVTERAAAKELLMRRDGACPELARSFNVYDLGTRLQLVAGYFDDSRLGVLLVIDPISHVMHYMCVVEAIVSERLRDVFAQQALAFYARDRGAEPRRVYAYTNEQRSALHKAYRRATAAETRRFPSYANSSDAQLFVSV